MRDLEGFEIEEQLNIDDNGVLNKLKKGNYDEKKRFDLNLKSNTLGLSMGFERLISLDTITGWAPFEHQKRTALRVIRDMQGRALLADEVGLGKTVEASIILKEYLMRGLVDRVLILTPASLLTQWREELKVKFDLEFKVWEAAKDWTSSKMLIASIDTAKRPNHSEKIYKMEYDMVIIDEAHKLKNNKTKGWSFVDGLKTRYILMLTATPVQNNMIELFNMITLLKPGQLKTYNIFQAQFMKDARSPKNVRRLRGLLTNVMIRNKRRDTGIVFPKRYVKTMKIHYSEAETKFYKGITDFVRNEVASSDRTVLPLVTLQKIASSSSRAACKSLRKMWLAEDEDKCRKTKLGELYSMASVIQDNKKAGALEKILHEQDTKTIVFTEFRITQEYLAKQLRANDIGVSLFHGGMTVGQKDSAIEEFKTENRVLLSTETGGEGRNLQFCNTLVNYDLPWNPMKIEQRIGRIHRIGQKSDVNIFNLVAADTIESYIVYLLEEKIKLFELIVGELGMIISNTNREKGFEQTIFDIVTKSSSEDEFNQRIEEYGMDLEKSRSRYLEVNELDREIFKGLC